MSVCFSSKDATGFIDSTRNPENVKSFRDMTLLSLSLSSSYIYTLDFNRIAAGAVT